MAKRRRIIFKLLAFLLAGAIINVAVAWGCAAKRSSAAFPPSTVREQPWLNHPPSEFPPLASRWGSLEQAGSRSEFQSATTVDQQEHERIQNVIQSILSRPNADARSTVRKEVIERMNDQLVPLQLGANLGNFVHKQISSGWPLLSFRGGSWNWHTIPSTANPQQIRFVHAIDLAELGFVNGSATGNRIIPLCPIWPGFAINTIFYAAILHALFAVPGAVRRRVRIRRGQCASCGYSLRENTSEKCPECGTLSPRRGAGM